MYNNKGRLCECPYLARGKEMDINALDRSVGGDQQDINHVTKEKGIFKLCSRLSNTAWKLGSVKTGEKIIVWIHADLFWSLRAQLFCGGETKTRLQGVKERSQRWRNVRQWCSASHYSCIIPKCKRKYSWLSADTIIMFVKSYLVVQHTLCFCFSKSFGYVLWALDSLGHFTCNWPGGLYMRVVKWGRGLDGIKTCIMILS